MDDLTLRDFVEDELEWEPRIDAANIGVAVEDGVVTLMGHVSSFAEKLAAEDAVKRVKGVRGIAQEIEVRLTGRPKTDDDEIASKAADVLDWDVSLPDNEIQVRVQNGWVTLSGEVDWNYQRDAAKWRVSSLPGVRGVSNAISVRKRASPSDIKARIEKALVRHAKTEASGIRVSVVDGSVVLDGVVEDWHDREVAEQAAWAAPGVVSVEDRLRLG